MFKLPRIVLFLLIEFISINLYSQQSSDSSAYIYGLDAVLYNGKQYLYYPPPGTGGHQYFSSSYYPSGSVWIRGNQYDNLRLNYDIYHQQLILFYKNHEGASKTIIVSDAWLKAFTLGSTRFIIRQEEDSTKHIYQEIGNEKQKLLYAWRKDWILDPGISAHFYIFTAPEKEQYLLKNNKLEYFKNNRSFIKLFDQALQPLIRKYIRQNKLRLKSAEDTKMSKLMDFISSISSQ